MPKQKLILTGDWNEGLTLAASLCEGSDFEPHRLDVGDIRATAKKRQAEACVICASGHYGDWLRKLEEIRSSAEGFPVFFLIATPDVEFAVSAVKYGAADVFSPPVDREKFIKRVGREVHLYDLTKKIFLGSSGYIDEQYRFENMIGRSAKMQDNFRMISAVAKSQATVLITGESGVGKELVAKAIHRASDRAQNRFVDINCGAIPRDLLENELFGHEKGSFTGAHKRYVGSFETAHKGTLFLDEISEMDVLLQVKLLRVLQERTFTRIGGNDRINVDVRIIAATNRNLHESIEKGAFREDLYYRLNVVHIAVPSLRERREDIPLLAKNFLEYFSAKNNRIFLDFASDAMEALINYDWPGNVRELENTIERVVVLNDDSEVKLKHLPPNIQTVNRAIGYAEEGQALTDEGGTVIPLEELERRAIEAALLKFHGNVALAAKKLNIGQATLYRKVKKFGFITA